MKQDFSLYISKDLSISKQHVFKTITLLNEGATVPFIARYRKEVTGSLDEVQIADIKQRLEFFTTLESRKNTILKSLIEQELLTNELEAKIIACIDSTELEDIYLPFKPKKKTKASIAIANGLEPLAKYIFSQKNHDFKNELQKYINENCKTKDEVLQGARNIIAEWVSENLTVRNKVRYAYSQNAYIASKKIKGKEEEAQKYEQYFEFKELLKKSPSHRLLAIMRADKEGLIRVSIDIDDTDSLLNLLYKTILKSYGDCAEQIKLAIDDSYKRLISPSIQKEMYNAAKERADKEAIVVFAKNLQQLLMLPPLGKKRVLAIDPGFRTGCKVVCLNEYGDLLHNETIYPHQPQSETKMAIKKIAQLVESYKIDAISIGDGTASRETERFIKKIGFPHTIQVFMVNEDGASIYSASKVAREEFPQYDITVRGAVSIGRRLMDPLAELVKIEPKSLGVGQYQHDVNQTELQNQLDFVVSSCVNNVGVELNTASKQLLSYVSGIGPVLAQNIIDYRKQNGEFTQRKELLKVPKMGKKTFEQCAGFLRIKNGKTLLDNTGVHPESYSLVTKMAKDLSVTEKELIVDKDLQKKIVKEKYITEDIGLPTIQDILVEISKPGRDPREKLKHFSFDETINTIGDLHVGHVLPGIITNVTNFGAFVNIGIKQNGLVHISQLANEYVSNPADVVSINQHVMVKVVEVDIAKGRIQLSMKDVE